MFWFYFLTSLTNEDGLRLKTEMNYTNKRQTEMEGESVEEVENRILDFT